MKDDCYSLKAILPLTQKKLEWLRKESKEKNFLMESLPKAAEPRKRGGRRARKRAERDDDKVSVRNFCAEMNLCFCTDCVRSGSV